MSKQTRVLVTGGGGFIGHHLVSYLRARGYWVRAVDIKYPDYKKRTPTNSSCSTCVAGTIVYRPRGA